MALTISDFLTKVKLTVKDDASRYTDAEKQEFIKQAVRAYSRDRPRERDALLAGDGSRQTFGPPLGWIQGWSQPVQIEHPINAVPPNYLDVQDNVLVIQRSDVEQIMLLRIAPASGEPARLYYTAQHTVDANTNTVVDVDFDAVCDLAAAVLCRALAVFYTESTDSSILADSVDHRDKARTFLTMAEHLKAQYIDHISAGDVETPVLALHDVDMRMSWGRDLLWHPARFR